MAIDSGFKWSARSAANLKGIHPKLLQLTNRALQLSTHDFLITDGLRTLAEQRAFVAKGVSKTMKSKHLTGRAVDFVALVAGKAKWDDVLMTEIAKTGFKAASAELGIPIVWGGDWKGSWDKSHIELAASVK